MGRSCLEKYFNARVLVTRYYKMVIETIFLTSVLAYQLAWKGL